MARTSDTREMKVGQEQTHDMSATGKIDRADFIDEFEEVDTPNWEVIKQEAFMNEYVEVMISEEQNPNAEQFIETSVNGVNQFFIRGEVQRVKRYFLEVLARANPYHISTKEFIDANGNKGTRIIKTPGKKYPFQVFNDSPDGVRWLQSIMMEA